MSGFLLSVIIPVYNVEEYIAECLDSVVNQTIGIDRIEVIVVDDVSPDNSIKIARRYADKYPSIKIIEREQNGGAGAARNTGLQHVTSEFVTFLDPDDFITLNTFEHLVNMIKKQECDLVIYEYDYYSPSGKVYSRNPSQALFVENRLITEINNSPEVIFSTSVCNKLFKTMLFDDVEFENIIFEDVLVSTLTTFKANRIYVTNECKYYYRKREDKHVQSTMDNYLAKRDSYFDHLYVNIKMHNLIKDFPQYKELIDWFNARSYVVFLVNSLKTRVLSLKDKRKIFKKSKIILGGISRTVIEKLENPLYRYALSVIKQSGYYKFFMLVVSYALKLKLSTMIRRFYKIFEVAMLVIVSKFVFTKLKKNEIWLICERGFEARDNGYHFFKYLRENVTNINAYYLIDKRNKLDYEKVYPLGNLVQYRSFKHKVLFVLASKLISAHKGTIEPWNYNHFKKYFGRFVPSKKYVFLQHGITKDDVSNVLGKKNAPFDLFITGAKPEYEYIKKHFGYADHEVAYTGFARFDSLHDCETEDVILLMPTWRNGIVQKSWDKDRVVSDETFLTSEYYKKYESLINNKVLTHLLERFNHKLIFYPHYEVQQYLKYFTTKNERIVLAHHDKYDVQELLKKSKLLITDFSSVFFDFAYMGKPVLYYQFDKNFFLANHYKKGYFDYLQDGFGEISEEEEEVIELLNYYFENNFKMREEYVERVQRFFPLKDKDNSKRIFEEIINME